MTDSLETSEAEAMPITLLSAPANHEQSAAQIREAAEALIWEAGLAGLIVTIETVPHLPLAMGNVHLVVDVRPARGHY